MLVFCLAECLNLYVAWHLPGCSNFVQLSFYNFLIVAPLGRSNMKLLMSVLLVTSDYVTSWIFFLSLPKSRPLFMWPSTRNFIISGL